MMLYKILLLLVLNFTSPGETSPHPNVVFILADDLGWNDVSFHGSRQIPTPNLDTLAYDGILLSQYYVQPICTPSRSALMTGRHPIHTGMQHSVLISAAPYGLSLQEKLLPQYLKELGYKTHIVGKWHLGFFSEKYTPLERGFDSHYGYYQGSEDYYDHTYVPDNPVDPKAWGLDFRRGKEMIKTAFGQYSTTLFTSEAENVIADHDASKPLFLYLAHQAVHCGNAIKIPLEAPWKYLLKFSYIKNEQRRKFAAMVSALDDSIGNVTKALHSKGILNNTIIIFSTDNGGPAAGKNHNDASNWPLRGVKEGLWEGGVRGPGFIWSPLLKQSGYTYNGMFQIFDWLPTILRAVGYNMSKLPLSLDGIDQWETLSINDVPRRVEMLHNIDDREHTAALRVGDMKVVISRGGSTKGWSNWYAPDEYHGDSTEQESYTFNQRNSDVNMEGNLAYNSADTEEAPDAMFESDLDQILLELGRKPQSPRPIVVECGPRPSNASTSCAVGKLPCVFNITADPCEYNNLAPTHPEALEELLWRLDQHNKTAVHPRNKPVDPAGLPCKHNGMWVPWVENG